MTNQIEKIVDDHNKAMREDMASEIVGGSRSKAITDVITVKAIVKVIRETLLEYNQFLQKNGYTDSDIDLETPTAIERFLSGDKE